MGKLLSSEIFGRTEAGEDVTLYRIKNDDDAYIEVLDYGCLIKGIYVRDDSGELRNVCLNYDTLKEYEQSDLALGGIPGRLGKAPFREFSHQIWSLVEEGENFVSFSRRSPAGEDGGKGNLDINARFMWLDYNRLVVDLTATGDAEEPINLSSNVLFNTDGSETLAGLKLRVFGDHYVKKDERGEYTGELLPLIGSAYDSGEGFLTLGADPYEEIFVSAGAQMRPLAEFNSMKSGISLTVYTDMPAVRFFTTSAPTTAAAFLGQFVPGSGTGAVPVLPAGKEWKQRIIYGLDRVYDALRQ
jgi:aldose 1-epimerase